MNTNYPTSKADPNGLGPITHYPVSLMVRTLLVMLLLIAASACGRGNGSSSDSDNVTSATQPEGPTPTSSAILAATPTPEGVTAAAVEPTSADVNDSPTDAENPAQSESADSESQVDSASQEVSSPPTCEQEIALDLVGHPRYAELKELMGCPTNSSSADEVAINEFGTGPDYDRFMLWFSTDKRIYVLRPEGTWMSYEDTWSEDQAEIQCNPTGIEETSPPLPRRGFGKLWCSETELQTVMGMVEREERLCQHTVIQQFEKGQVLGCFEDATIRYIQLFQDGSWDMRFVQ